MKVKRYKRMHKSLNFYTNNFGFREPYQILVDGTFCQAALTNKINIADNVPRYLHGEIKLLTTPCAIVELENLGHKLKSALHILKNYGVHMCGHQAQPISGSKCFMSMVNDTNKNHYIIATQDRELQDELRNNPGVPLLYLHSKTPILEQPSAVSLEFVKNKLGGITKREIDALEELKAKNNLNKGEEMRPKKRKKKNPNPLSCKKKQKVSQIVVKKDVTEGKQKKVRRRIRIAEHVKEELMKKIKSV